MDISKRKKDWIKWNQKIHIYVGFYLLFFIWLFGISGVLLNHHWKFANSWENRKEIKYDKTIEIRSEREEEFSLVHEIMNKLELSGSINNIRYSNDSIFLNFNISKPGTSYNIQANLNDGNIMIAEIKFDSWGAMKALHSLRNPTLREKSNRYQAIMASIWSISMDIVAAGLIIICLGAWFMWLQFSRKRFFFGLISITGGFILCIFYLLN